MEDVEVVVAIVMDHDGRILTVRDENPIGAMRWMFPGGKIEPQEAEETVCRREGRPASLRGNPRRRGGRYLDSGTMAYIVAGGRIPRCARMPWALCLEPSRAFAAAMIDATGEETATSFSVGDYQSIGDHRLGAFDGAAIAADEGSKSFVWGAPYFLGKRIALVFEGLDVSGKTGQRGPFFAVK